MNTRYRPNISMGSTLAMAVCGWTLALSAQAAPALAAQGAQTLHDTHPVAQLAQARGEPRRPAMSDRAGPPAGAAERRRHGAAGQASTAERRREAAADRQAASERRRAEAGERQAEAERRRAAAAERQE